MVVRDPDAFDAIARHGRSALAWEVLRRDPDYQAAFAGVVASRAEPAFVAGWGLHFP